MRYSAHQSSFLPWIWFWMKMNCSDVFDVSIYDQYTRWTRQNYTFLPSKDNGKKIKWWIFPSNKYLLRTPLKEIKVEPWFACWLIEQFKNVHFQDKFFDCIFPQLNDWLFSVDKLKYLIEINQILINRVVELLDLHCLIINAPKIWNKTSEEIINNVIRFWCSEYLSWPHWKNYLDEHLFLENNIKVLYQNTEEIYHIYNYSIVSMISMFGLPFVMRLLNENFIDLT